MLLFFLPLFILFLISFPKFNNNYINNFNITNQKRYINQNYSDVKSVLSLFIGFIDADGYIRISSQKNLYDKNHINISIVLNLKYSNEDRYMLEYIKEVLNIGYIYNITPRKGNKIIRFEISKSDIKTKLYPLLSKYNIKFLTEDRQKQYYISKYILDNNIIYYDDINLNKEIIKDYINKNIIKNNFNKYSFFNNWLIGFTIGNGSFLIKKNGDACYQLKQKNNYNLLLDINNYFDFKYINIFTNRKIYNQLTISSVNNITTIINFFNDSNNNHPLLGSKLTSYNNWLLKLNLNSRYKSIFKDKKI
uniref:Homing endonuclease LAGLIDADG domain-containing protein n=1 Tax=Ogataea polymorpha TaxID=460523 RepID=S5U3P2_9ASCO|nr:hypothetical protein [Ogataea polymorpha]AGS44033.1 hypothetical protein [Ogataea polymorpha]